mmetsp:Transcript_115663/g.327792  ORF Transcript_115663/g.327792 Transcript_115663/m.327792 type:complete len:506 (+) Transcript_115663:103-1620(+)
MALGFANYKLDDFIAIARAAQLESEAQHESGGAAAWQDGDSEACPALDWLRPGFKLTEAAQAKSTHAEAGEGEEADEGGEDAEPHGAPAGQGELSAIDEPEECEGRGREVEDEEEDDEEEERRKWEEVVYRRWNRPAQPRERSPSPPSPRHDRQHYSDELDYGQIPVSFSVDGYFPKVQQPQRQDASSLYQLNLDRQPFAAPGANRTPNFECSAGDASTRAPSSSSSAASSTATPGQVTAGAMEPQSSFKDEAFNMTEELPPIEEDESLGDTEWEKRWAMRAAAFEAKQRANAPAVREEEEPLPPEPPGWTPHAAGFGPRCCIAGTWDHWRVQDMQWDKAGCHYAFNVCLGSKSWESFQILCDGDRNKCLHPDRADASIHTGFDLRGPDRGDGRHWTIGKHPLDGGFEGAMYKVRLFLDATQQGQPCRLDWVPVDGEDGDEAAAAPSPASSHQRSSELAFEHERREGRSLRERLAIAKKRSPKIDMQHRRKLGPTINLVSRPIMR